MYGDKLLGRENESYKSFRVSVNDSCSRILPSVLKKYKIDDSWQNYALFIQHKGQGKKSIGNSLNLIIMLNFYRRTLFKF